jgi:DNA-binding transcriptional regulator WhiA
MTGVTPSSAARRIATGHTGSDGRTRQGGVLVTGAASTHPNLARANAARSAAAAARNAQKARQALEVLGGSCRPSWREAAKLRIAWPSASWAQIAARMPADGTGGTVSRHVPASRFRRLLAAAGMSSETADRAETGK